MNLLVVGVSHHTAPVALLERLSVAAADAPTLLADLTNQPHVGEVVALSTCNRVEIYGAVSAFHGGLAEVGAVLAARAGVSVAELAPYLYLYYDADAVRHAYRVAAGLDSMVVGESQILGQLREAYGTAVEREATGRLLHELMQQALRVGKRVHAETGIDRAGQSVVTAALALALQDLRDHELRFGVGGASRDGSHDHSDHGELVDHAGSGHAGPGNAGPVDLTGRSALVVGAGSMGALALATLHRAGAGPLLVTNRSADRAQRLAELYGATAVDQATLTDTLSTVDLVVCATASVDPVLTEAAAAEAVAHRDGRPLLVLDLAVPRDVEPAVADLPGVTLVDIARLGDALSHEESTTDRSAAEEIVATEVEAFLTWMRGADVAPTVAALRTRADEVVAFELSRLAQRCPNLTDEQRADVAQTVHRVVQRLLHPPTVRVRQLAATPDGDQYAAVLRELFDLEVPPQPDAARAIESLEPASQVDTVDTVDTVDPVDLLARLSQRGGRS